MNYTISEDFVLPSLGKVYRDKVVNPNVRLRTMTTEEEMLRLSHSERPYKLLCDMIENCIVGDKPGISVYDMCLQDYQYLLHKLRVVTYGPEYEIKTICRWCGAPNIMKVDLDKMPVKEYTDDLEQYFEFTLPRSQNIIGLKLQTPRSADDLSIKIKEFKRKTPDAADPSLLYTIKSLVNTIDGQIYDPVRLDSWARKLPMADTNCILKNAKTINNSFGIDTNISVECKECGVDYDTPFRITSEFFGPGVDA